MLAALLAASPSLAAEIVGRASVIDGDTIEIRGERIRLHGFDAPEMGQTCSDASGRPYRCGQRAAMFLADWIGSAPVSCQRRGSDRFGRTVGACMANGQPFGAVMVAAGWALPDVRHGGAALSRYAGKAREARRGMWAGNFTTPWEWRAAQRRGGGSGHSGPPRTNCTELRARGLAPVMRGSPHYHPGLDRDGDGIGCE